MFLPDDKCPKGATFLQDGIVGGVACLAVIHHRRGYLRAQSFCR